MKNYIVYNLQGKILRTGICPDDMFDIQAQKGEYIIEGTANDRLQKIVNGKVVDKLLEEIPSKPQPDPKETLIRQKMNEILRRMAIKELETQGKL